MTAAAPTVPPSPATRTLGRDLVAALVTALAAVSFYVSAASLLFQGPLAPHLPLAVGAALAGGVLLSAWWAWRGSLPQASVGAEPATVPVLAALTAGLAANCTPEAVMPTAVVALALTALLVGVLWWTMGRRGWGDVIRYIPYPVIGGFIASIGWLMLVGGLGVSTGHPLVPTDALAWFAAQPPGPLASGVLIGVLLWQVAVRARHVMLLPLAIVGAGLLVHAGLWAAGLDLAAARAQGWLLAPFNRALPPLPWSPDLLAAVQWREIAAQSGLILSAAIVATIGLLLSDTSLEVAWDVRADLNRDLVALGQANVGAALLGGLAGGVSISRSALNRAAGAAGRASGAWLALVCAAAMLGGGPVLALVPRPLLGGLLIYLALGMLKTWLFDMRVKLPRRDLLTVWGMVAVTALFGFLPAVCVGVLACCVDFAAASAALSPVRRLVAADAWPSRVERSPSEQALLQSAARGHLVVQLQGVLFFGSATRLVRELEGVLAGVAPPARLLFDFGHVRWLDSSAAQAFGRLLKQARAQGCGTALSALPDGVRRTLAAAGVPGADGPAVHADIDAALARWDDEVLAATPAPAAADVAAAALAGLVPDAAQRERLAPYLEPRTLAAGERLFAQGEPSDALFLVRQGRLEASVVVDGQPLPVRTVAAGGAVGEMGLFRDRPRSATLVAVAPTEVLVLRRERLAALEAADPVLAAAVYRGFVGQLASRLEQSTAQLGALAR